MLNRANARQQIFVHPGDYAAFERVLAEALGRTASIELFTYCLMPNHWHLVLRPAGDDDLSQFMRWLTVTHTQRWHANHRTSGTGHLYQGRFKSFPVESDERHFLAVCRYAERNPLRANLIAAGSPGTLPRAEDWRWSGLWWRARGEADVVGAAAPRLAKWPVDEPADWLALVNRPQSRAEEEALRRSVVKGRPFGSETFEEWTAEALGLAAAFRERGRPRKERRRTVAEGENDS